LSIAEYFARAKISTNQAIPSSEDLVGSAIFCEQNPEIERKMPSSLNISDYHLNLLTTQLTVTV
jgi:hypothetical protein